VSSVTSAVKARVLPLTEGAPHGAGGKAEGLRLLASCGLRIPETWIITEPLTREDHQELDRAMESLGNVPVAVRSSAADEDGTGASFAGQFETYLNVRGKEDIGQAVENCFRSSRSYRVEEYADHIRPSADLKMSVLIQEMVDARFAGVIFTADPVTNRWDHTVINATEGLGESLVSGHSSGEQYLLSRSGKIISRSDSGEDSLLDDDLLEKLFLEARQAGTKAGHPLDLEWAVNREGELVWLQSRPITTLDPVHLNELEPELAEQYPILTRGNIGEMMPGPVTPLTDSVFGHGIDYGLQDFYYRFGVMKRPVKGNRHFIFLSYNHFFFVLSRLYVMARRVVNVTKASVDYSITGEILDDPWPDPVQEGWLLPRIYRFIKYMRYISTAPKQLEQLRKLNDGFHIKMDLDAEGLYRELNRAKDVIDTAWCHHYATSGQSGALNATMLQILSGGKTVPDRDNYREVAELLVDIEGIDGANALQALDRLAEKLREERGTEHFVNLEPMEAYKWLNSDESGESGLLFREFMKENGHRCIREAEFREKDWETDPEGLIRLLQARVSLPPVQKEEKEKTFEKNRDRIFSRLSFVQKMILKSMMPSIRSSVARRENSKSLCIRIQNKARKAYIRLGELLTEQGLLDDPDQVFFLTHEETGELLRDRDPSWKERAGKRREVFPEAKKLVFHDHYWGLPEPVEHRHVPELQGGELNGLPVSVGSVTGRARIVNSLDDAGDIQPGEIMVVSYTDIGWTPYFSLISGLITEIGSSLSHGAVVAREYGIPAVVNLKNAKQLIGTGDRIEIDGSNGIVRIIEKGTGSDS
jgi:pyruvate,water dikinase